MNDFQAAMLFEMFQNLPYAIIEVCLPCATDKVLLSVMFLTENN